MTRTELVDPSALGAWLDDLGLPGTGAPSGRPTHTPMVILPSKPTDQASR